eukprot:TRINITY_DN2797_c0_g1_i2.p1 TRINITY_DN2797_c0_g1~~TRINITY_DN2797_c0_g1_i2.p1  ORF type:complete len:842 (-),score=117.31 TRINITY_DN2797_c0_g1_i2:414-2939(-)
MAFRRYALLVVGLAGVAAADATPPQCSLSPDASTSSQCSQTNKHEQLLIQLSHLSAKMGELVSQNRSSCCSGCAGKPYCSPNSGSCYSSKAKDYYASCSCCGKCEGSAFCSPVSGSCYDSKKRNYYQECTGVSTTAPATTTGSAPSPVPGSSTKEPVAPCCSGCQNKPFCSPGSGNCYRSKNKDYYASCPVVPCEGTDCPIGYEASNRKSGAGQWCEIAKPPSTWLPLKTCPPGTGSLTVKVLAYNLFWWNLFQRRGGEDGRAGRKIATTSGPEEYDFMGFQECDDVGRVMRDAKRWGLSGDYGTINGGRALAIVYRKCRWTLLASGKEDVGEDNRRQYYGRRSAQWARFRHTDGRTSFFANHHGPLPVNQGGGCTGSACAYNMLRMVAENAHKNDAVFLVGDFNAQKQASRIKALDAHIHRIFTGSAIGGVDHIYSNCGDSHVVRTQNLGSGGSDHDALMSVFDIPLQIEGGEGVSTTAPAVTSTAPIVTTTAPASTTTAPVTTTTSLAPVPAPSTQQPVASCCSKCQNKPFCSPNSGNCYRSKNKDYYASCTIIPCEGMDCPIGYETSNDKSGSGQWCEIAKAPSTWLPLKACPQGTGSLKVKVLAYNLFWWNLFQRRGGEDGRAGRKIASTSGPEEYDFMGFQECDDVSRVMGDAKRWGLSGDYGTINGGRALAIAYRKSRWTLIASGKEDVGEDNRQQYYGRRSAHWARFRHRDGRTAFFANHHGPLPVGKSGGCTGSACAYNMLRMIAENAHKQDLVFFVGDFNAQTWSSRVTSLDKHINRVFSGSSHGGVDHIYSNCGGSHVVESKNLGSGGSDHDALMSVFDVPLTLDDSVMTS